MRRRRSTGTDVLVPDRDTNPGAPECSSLRHCKRAPARSIVSHLPVGSSIADRPPRRTHPRGRMREWRHLPGDGPARGTGHCHRCGRFAETRRALRCDPSRRWSYGSAEDRPTRRMELPPRAPGRLITATEQRLSPSDGRISALLRSVSARRASPGCRYGPVRHGWRLAPARRLRTAPRTSPLHREGTPRTPLPAFHHRPA